MLRGLEEVESELRSLHIPFQVLFGAPKMVIPSFAASHGINLVVTDFSPLRISKQWMSELAPKLSAKRIHLTHIDAHNSCPVWSVSSKQEYAARTIRNKVHSKLKQFLVEFPPIVRHSPNSKVKALPKTDWTAARRPLPARAVGSRPAYR